MGNKVCCEENRTQHTNLESVEPEIVGRNRTEVHESKEEERYEQPENAPEVSYRVKDALDREQFFYNQFQDQTNPQKKRYGEDFYLGDIDEEHKPNGLGRMYKNNGGLYMGYFQHGRAQGKGAFIFEDGSYYYGDFHNNRAESQNGRYASEQLIYEGTFRDNKFDGQGVEKGRNNSYRFQGNYINGARERGTLSWSAENGDYKYEGPFNSYNQFHGQGTLEEPNGKYKGFFSNGEKDGENGTYHSTNGTRYEGSYVNGNRDGYGTIYNGDDTIAYQGEMKNGLPHGNGFIMKNGHKLTTKWVEGIDVNLLPESQL